MMEYYELDQTSQGKACLSLDALNSIASIAAGKIEEVLPLKKNGNLAEVSLKDGNLKVVLNVRILQNADITTVAGRLQKEVYLMILQMIGVKAQAVDVNIVGFFQRQK